jgi:hypothetical protein
VASVFVNSLVLVDQVAKSGGKAWVSTKMKRLWFVLLLILCPSLYAQTWSGVLAPSRAVDWSSAGVVGGIPNRTTICTTLTSSATSAQIDSAIASCSSSGGGVVSLGAGTYSGATSGFSFNGASNVTVRGAGANQTFFAPTSSGITINSSDNNWRGDPENLTAWSVPAHPSGTYPQGTSQITLATVANLKVGNPIILDQLDPTTDNGGIIVSQATTAQAAVAPGLAGPYSTQGSSQSMRGPSNGACAGNATCRSQEQIVTVSSCNGVTTVGSACSGSNVVVGISPGLEMPNWSSAQSPEAWWAASPALNDGVEDLSLNLSACNGCNGINFFNAQNSWVKGVSSMNSSGEGQLRIEYGNHISIVSNYMAMSAGGTGSYGAEAFSASDCLIENNIMQGVTTPQISNGTTSGCVFGYNYSVNEYYTPSPGYNIPAHGDHGSGVAMVLVEGNITNGATGDNIHGTANLNTHFRNYFTGPQPVCYESGGSQTSATYEACNNNVMPEQLWAFHRFYNLIGNVLGTPGTNTIYTSTTYVNGVNTAVIGENYGNSDVPSDPNVSATLMLWGNADSATGFASPRFNCSEVPTALTGVQAPFSNPCPASHTLPASFYYSSAPSWWPSGKPFPPIGPDVTGGNVAGVDGHVYTIPAEDCYTSLGGNANGTGPALTNFNEASCYSQTVATQPQPPTDLTATVD